MRLPYALAAVSTTNFCGHIIMNILGTQAKKLDIDNSNFVIISLSPY
jgi:hypothetical protein